jgi:murein DD-endopeptidase MepM/ murein hydrolase activator NlpD
MINPSAVLGLENTPAYDNLKQIKVGIEVLVKHKARDYESERRHFKQEKEDDRREKQDLKFIQDREAKEIIKFQKFMKSKEGGLTAALLGGAALLGALTLIGAIDIPKMVGDIWNKLKEMFGFGPSTQDQEEVEEAAENPPATGDVSAMEPAEQEGSGTPLKMPPGVSKGSPIGMRRHPVHGTMKHHNGVDIPAPTGTPLTIKGNGKFVSSGFEKGYGNWVVIRDQRGEHFYSHLSKFGKFKAGDSIKTGDVVGYVGTTGTSTGPHLHWEFDTSAGLVGNQRPPSKVMDPYANGYTYKTPFTGLQTGGAIGKSGAQNPKLTGNYKTAYNSIKRSFPEAGAHHIAAAMGNFDTEAPGLKPDTYQMNGGPGRGIAQWEIDTPGKLAKGIPGRWEYAEDKYGKGIINSLPKQLDYFAFEMKTGNPVKTATHKGKKVNKGGPLLPKGRDAKPMWLGAKDLTSATKGFMLGYEAPGKPHWDKRLKAAQGIHKQIKAEPDSKFLAQKPVGKQRGGAVGYQGGGMVNLASRRIPSPNQNFYDNNFFVRQGRKGKGGVVIVVNNTSSGGYGGGSGHSDITQTYGVVPTTPINYTDISQTYYRYIRGIKS